MQHVSQNRKQGKDFIGNATQLACQRRKTGLEVLEHAQPGKDFTALRHERQTGTGAFVPAVPVGPTGPAVPVGPAESKIWRSIFDVR